MYNVHRVFGKFYKKYYYYYKITKKHLWSIVPECVPLDRVRLKHELSVRLPVRNLHIASRVLPKVL